MLVILASIFIILLVLGMPIAFTMGIACLGTVVYSQMPLNMLITRMFSADGGSVFYPCRGAYERGRSDG